LRLQPRGYGRRCGRLARAIAALDRDQQAHA
jgi:hypothetical protein